VQAEVQEIQELVVHGTSGSSEIQELLQSGFIRANGLNGAGTSEVQEIQELVVQGSSGNTGVSGSSGSSS
jgi:fructose/tagatose bisphosphate aldolase